MIDDGNWKQEQILISLILLSVPIPPAMKGARVCHGKYPHPKARNSQNWYFV